MENNSSLKDVEFISARNFLFSGSYFRKVMLSCVENRDYKALTTVIKDVTEFNPTLYPQLVKFYELFIVGFGELELADQVKETLFEAVQKVNVLNDNTYKQPPVLDLTNCSDIGEFIDKVVAIQFLSNTLEKMKKPILIISNVHSLNKGSLAPYLQKNFELVLEDKSIASLRRKMFLPDMTSDFIGHNKDSFFHFYEYVSEVTPLLRTQNRSVPVFELQEETKKIADQFLRRIEIEISTNYVVIELQPSTAEGDRDSFNFMRSIAGYINSINLLLRSGLKVIFLGPPQPINLKEFDGLIDLSAIKRPFEVDISLIAQAKFFLGGKSTGSTLAHAFGTPQLMPNAIPFSGCRATSFAQCARFFWSRNDQLLSIEEIKSNGLFSAFAPQLLKHKGIYCKPYNSEQIEEATKEMLDYLEGGENFKLNECFKHEKQKYGIYGGLCSNTLKLLD